MITILITGGCGFIGHHVVEHILKNTDWNIIILDKLNYASMGFERIREIDIIENMRIKVLTYDLQYSLTIGMIKEIGCVDYIIHMAAETHVDNSIEDSDLFVHSNINGVHNLLKLINKKKYKKPGA